MKILYPWIMSHFLPLVIPDQAPRPPDMEVPAPDPRFMSTKSISGMKAILNVLNYLINPAIMHAGS